MALYVTVSSGERAGLARPLLAISDQAMVAEMLRPLGRLFEEYAEPDPGKESRPSPIGLPKRAARKGAARTPMLAST